MTEKKYATGLVIGKFTPYHRGHRFLIETALSQCLFVNVIVVHSTEYAIPTKQRVEWISHDFDSHEVAVQTISKDQWELDDNDSKGWAVATLMSSDVHPDAVFTSENYGDTYVAALNDLYKESDDDYEVVHVLVDKARTTVPITGTEIRNDPSTKLEYLPSQVRWNYVKKVCIIGAESTGKTTLARALSEVYETRFVPEFGQYYTEAQAYPENHVWTTGDLMTIARTQKSFELDATSSCGPLLICDTSLITTAIFHDVLVGAPSHSIEAMADNHLHDLYLLCDPKTPFSQDVTETRMEDKREYFHDRYLQWLWDNKLPVVHVTGNAWERFEYASQQVDTLLATNGYS